MLNQNGFIVDSMTMLFEKIVLWLIHPFPISICDAVSTI